MLQLKQGNLLQADADALVNTVNCVGVIQSIAIPPLGCGLGGLDWVVVQPMIERAFEVLPEVDVYLYAPPQTR